jgi:hypothetical protein
MTQGKIREAVMLAKEYTRNCERFPALKEGLFCEIVRKLPILANALHADAATIKKLSANCRIMKRG